MNIDESDKSDELNFSLSNKDKEFSLVDNS